MTQVESDRKLSSKNNVSTTLQKENTSKNVDATNRKDSHESSSTNSTIAHHGTHEYDRKHSHRKSSGEHHDHHHDQQHHEHHHEHHNHHHHHHHHHHNEPPPKDGPTYPPTENPSQKSLPQDNPNEEDETEEEGENEEPEVLPAPVKFLQQITFDWLKEENSSGSKEDKAKASGLIQNILGVSVNESKDLTNVLNLSQLNYSKEKEEVTMDEEEEERFEPDKYKVHRRVRRAKEWIVQCKGKSFGIDDEKASIFAVSLSPQVSEDEFEHEEFPVNAIISQPNQPWGIQGSVRALRGSAIQGMSVVASNVPSRYTIQSTISSRHNKLSSCLSVTESGVDFFDPADEPIWQRGRHFDHPTDLSKRHFITLINTLNYDIKIMEATQSTPLSEVRDRYKKYNPNIDNYSWKDVYEKPLDLSLTLHQNGLVDNSYITDEIGLDYYPLILLFFNDGFENDPPMQLDIRKAFIRDEVILCRNYGLPEPVPNKTASILEEEAGKSEIVCKSAKELAAMSPTRREKYVKCKESLPIASKSSQRKQGKMQFRKSMSGRQSTAESRRELLASLKTSLHIRLHDKKSNASKSKELPTEVASKEGRKDASDRQKKSVSHKSASSTKSVKAVKSEQESQEKSRKGSKEHDKKDSKGWYDQDKRDSESSKERKVTKRVSLTDEEGGSESMTRNESIVQRTKEDGEKKDSLAKKKTLREKENILADSAVVKELLDSAEGEESLRNMLIGEHKGSAKESLNSNREDSVEGQGRKGSQQNKDEKRGEERKGSQGQKDVIPGHHPSTVTDVGKESPPSPRSPL